MSTVRRIFRPALTPRVYGYTNNQPTDQPGTASGYLLPWDVLDDEAERVVSGRPPMYVIVAEIVTDGVRHPEVAVSHDYMTWAGYHREDRRWKVA